MNFVFVFVVLGFVTISAAEGLFPVNTESSTRPTPTLNEASTTASGSSFTVNQGPIGSSRLPSSPICYQPQIRGDCKALLRRYSYDQTAGACREFFYGGCGGNENRFESKEECELKCSTGNAAFAFVSATEEPANVSTASKFGQCPPSNAPIQDPARGTVPIQCSNSCTQDSECPNDDLCCNVDACGRAICMRPLPGSEQNVRSRSLAVATPINPICQKPLDGGPCRAYFPRWGLEGSACVQFVFGGCQGNGNNFETKEECERTCGIAAPTTTTECPMIKILPPPGCEIVTNISPSDGCPKPEIRCTEGACAGNPCPNLCDNCINEPKQCLTSPCPQYRCEPKGICNSARNALVVPPPLPTPPPLPDKQPDNVPQQSLCALVLCAPNTVCREVQGFATCVPNIVAISQSKASSRAQTVCPLQPDTGRCRAAIERWFFNVLSTRCEQFVYGGCGGNENNFDTRQACESFCSVFIDTANNEKEGQCPHVNGFADQVGICADECAFDLQCPGDRKCCSNLCGGRVCVPPAFSTTAAIENATVPSNAVVTIPTTTVAAILEATPTTVVDNIRRSQPRASSPTLETMRRCRQRVDPGPCKAAFVRWHFNIVTGECEAFTFGGCAGNSNNFDLQEQCQQTCDQVPPCPQYSPPLPAPGCAVVSWTGTDGCPAIGFKCAEGECTRATCPGKCDFCVNEPKQCFRAPCPQFRCQANETCLFEQCATVRCGDGLVCKVDNGSVACLPDETTPVNRCTQPKDSGPCEAAMIRYFFNPSTGRCEQFVYGGCKGNANRFDSVLECERTCPGNRGVRVW